MKMVEFTLFTDNKITFVVNNISAIENASPVQTSIYVVGDQEEYTVLETYENVVKKIAEA